MKICHGYALNNAMTFFLAVGIFLAGFLVGVLLPDRLKPRPKRRATKGTINFVVADKDITMSKGVVHTDSPAIQAGFTLVDSTGAAVTPTVPPVWSMANTAVATMTPAADGLTAAFSGFHVGDSTVDVVIDAADSESGTPLHLSGELQVLAAGAVSGDVVFTIPPSVKA